MMRCPDCGAEAEEDLCSPEHISDGQAYEWIEIHTYTCPKCGCEFTETYETVRKVTVDKYGECPKCRHKFGAT